MKNPVHRNLLPRNDSIFTNLNVLGFRLVLVENEKQLQISIQHVSVCLNCMSNDDGWILVIIQIDKRQFVISKFVLDYEILSNKQSLFDNNHLVGFSRNWYYKNDNGVATAAKEKKSGSSHTVPLQIVYLAETSPNTSRKHVLLDLVSQFMD